MGVGEALTLALAIIGASLGVWNTWQAHNDRRVILRVTPQWAFAPGFQGLSIDVVNLSAFPVTVVELGFLLGRSKGPLPKRAPVPPQAIVNGVSLPLVLPRHGATSVVFAGVGFDTLPITKAFARTSSGALATGDSPALRQFIRDNVRPQ